MGGIMKAKIFVLKDSKSKTVAMATLVVDDIFIKNFRVVSGSKGLFVSFPCEKVKEEYKDTVFAYKEKRDEIAKCIMDEYEKEAGTIKAPQGQSEVANDDGFYPADDDSEFDLPF